MDKSLENAFSAQTLTGHWKIQSEDYPKEYLGELSYDPRKGIHQLVLYGLCIFPSDDAPQNLTITGAITTGKNASVFNCMIVNAETGSGGILKQKTFFSFLSFCVGEESFPSKDLIRLKSILSVVQIWKYGLVIVQYAIDSHPGRKEQWEQYLSQRFFLFMKMMSFASSWKLH